MTRLAFVDEPARLAEVPLDATVVAVEPSVALATDALPLDAHLDDLELEALGEETYPRVEELCHLLDAPWRFQELKPLVDGLLARQLGAKRLLEAGGGEPVLLLREGSLAGAAIGALVGGRPTLADSPAAVLRRRRLVDARIALRRELRRRRPRILSVDDRYNLPPIATELRRRGADVLLWLPPWAPPEPRNVDIAAGAALFRIAGLDLWPALEPFLRRLVAAELPLDRAALTAARAAVRRDRPDALLGSTYASPALKAAAVAAREAGVPVVVTRHGEMGIRALPVMRLNDLDVVDHVLAWGTWEADFVARYAPRPVRADVVGAPMIEEVAATAPSREEIRARLGFRDDERVVLLVPTALSGDDWYAGHRVPYDLSHLRHQIGLVEQLLAVEGVRVAVREQQGFGMLEAWASRRGEPITFIRDVGFAELIHLADELVLDFPSTTLVQALCGSSRITVVRHPVTAWEPGVLEHLAAHGIDAVDPGDLAKAIREPGVVVRRREALEPLAASGPGTAAERAADAVLRIAGF